MRRGPEGPADSLRVSVYRVALIVSGVGLVALAAWPDWRWLLLTGSALLLLLALSLRRPPEIRTTRSQRRGLFAPLLRWVERSGFVSVLLFAALCKLGDAALAPMIQPFWIDRVLSPAENGTVSTTLGVGVTIPGPMAGDARVH